jgi:Activator of Hsp90 ATPase homolog 1-like protein
MNQIELNPVEKTIEVPCDPATAFSIFAERTSTWWPLDKHSVSAMSGKAAKAVTIEPREGGLIFETTADGKREIWGSVVLWQPARRLKLAWHVMREKDQATSVDIAFEPVANGTRVSLVHSGFEVLGEEARETRNGYESGWVGVFEKGFADACAAAV